MKVRKCLLYISVLLSFFFCTISLAQNPLKNFYFHHLKTEQGLSNGIIYDLLKDKEGFLWIATYNGLNCFDGSHFKTWKADPSQKNKLPNNVVQGLCEDSHGNIWCTSDVGISRYDRSKNDFETYKLLNSGSNKAEYGTMYKIKQCRNGEIITHSQDGIYVYNTSKNEFTYYPGNNKNDTISFDQVNRNCFVEDPYEAGIWLATRSGMRYFDLTKRVFYSITNNPLHSPVFNQHEITALALDGQNRIWYCDADNQKIYAVNLNQNKIIDSISTKLWQPDGIYVNTILIDKDNNKWISTFSNHLYFVNGKTGTASEFKNQIDNSYSVTGNNFYACLEEDDGTVNLGMVGDISYTNLEQNFFSIHVFPDSIRHTKHYQLNMLLNCDKQHNVWTAPSYAYALKCNPVTDSYSKYDFFPKDKKYNDTPIKITAMEPADDKLYFGTSDGLYEYDIKRDQFEKNKFISAGEKMEGKLMLIMCLARNNELWFTSHHNGIFRYNILTHQYKHYLFNEKDSNSFTNNYIFDIHEDLKGDIWIVSEFDGLMKYNARGDNFIYLMRNKSTSLPEQIYVTVVNDVENNLWLSDFVNGLTRYNPRTNEVKIISSNSGLSNLAYRDVIFDEKNNLWLSCFYQYSVLNLNTITAFNFDIDYARNSDVYANKLCLMNDGRIASETANGYILLDPAYRILKSKMEPVTISNFTAGDWSLPFIDGEGKINLSYSQNFFSFDFSCLSFLKKPNIKFAYKFEGVDKDWVYSGLRQTVYYTNVSGGDYTFRVKVQDENGIWNETQKPVRIYISSVFYATVWFKLILLVLLCTFVYWYYRLWRKKELKRKSEQAISYFANSVSGRNRVDEILWDITHNVIERSDFVDCVVYMVDENRNVLIQKAAFGNKNPEAYQILNPIEIAMGHGIVGTVAQTGIPEIVNDTKKDTRYIEDDAERMSELAVPIVYEGKVIGVIDSEHPQKNFFTKEHLELVNTIASITATKIINAQKEIEITENAKRLDDLKLQMAYTRQQALRAQMNPHFIFNCLNSINGFILQNDASTASSFLIKFSKLIRLILEHSHEKTITLQSELDALKLYIEMEKLRFEKKFSYQIKVDEEVSTETTMVPPLIFQPFVENSIWHGLLHKEEAGDLLVHISQKENMLECLIEDNGIGRERSNEYKSGTTTKKKSLGLKLTKERLSIMNEHENRKSSVEVVDLVNPDGHGAGTRVIIKFEQQEE